MNRVWPRVGWLTKSWKALLAMRPKFFLNTGPHEKVTKFLVFQLNILKMLGLFRMATINSCHARLHKLYMFFVQALYAVTILLNVLCFSTPKLKTIEEISIGLLQTLGIITIFFEINLLNKNADNLSKVLLRMNRFDFTGQENVFRVSRKLETLTFVIFSGFILFVILFRFLDLIVFLLRSKESETSCPNYEYLRSLLPICLVLPFLGESAACYYGAVVVVEIYLGVLCYVLGVIQASFFPIILLHLSGQHIVLSRRLQLLGRETFLLPEHMRWPRMSRHHAERFQQACEVLEMKKCIIFHQSLIDFRNLLDSVVKWNFTIRVVFIILIVSVSSYPLTVLSHYNTRLRALFIVQATLPLGFTYYNCLLSEILEWANGLIRQAMYQSRWYTMCPEARGMMLMLMRITQKTRYIRSLGEWRRWATQGS